MLLGSFLYEMLAGQLPFAADNVGALAERQLQGPRPLRKIRSMYPEKLMRLFCSFWLEIHNCDSVMVRYWLELWLRLCLPIAPDHRAPLHLLQVWVESPISFRSLLSALSLWLQLHFGLNSALFCGAPPGGF